MSNQLNYTGISVGTLKSQQFKQEHICLQAAHKSLEDIVKSVSGFWWGLKPCMSNNLLEDTDNWPGTASKHQISNSVFRHHRFSGSPSMLNNVLTLSLSFNMTSLQN